MEERLNIFSVDGHNINSNVENDFFFFPGFRGILLKRGNAGSKFFDAEKELKLGHLPVGSMCSAAVEKLKGTLNLSCE